MRPMKSKTAFVLLSLVASTEPFLELSWIAPLGVHALAVNKQTSGHQVTIEHQSDTSGLKGNSLRGSVSQKNLRGRFLHITDIVRLSSGSS